MPDGLPPPPIPGGVAGRRDAWAGIGLCLVAAVVLGALSRWGDVESAEQIAALGGAVLAVGGAVLFLYRLLPPADRDRP